MDCGQQVADVPAGTEEDAGLEDTVREQPTRDIIAKRIACRRYSMVHIRSGAALFGILSFQQSVPASIPLHLRIILPMA